MAGVSATHYEVLGVDPSASPAEVRQAYVARARVLHPDRLQGLPAGEAAQVARAMQDVNEAWRVLRTPSGRAHYDAQLAARSAPAAAPPRPAGGAGGWDGAGAGAVHHHVPVEPGVAVLRGLPWIVVLFVLGLIFVFTAFAGGAGETERRSGYDLVGSCVQSQRGVGVVEVPCASPNEGRVELVVTRQGQCPDDSVARQVPGEASWVCLRPAPAGG